MMEETELETLRTSLESELSSLGRVFHRLAITDNGKSLEKVLTLLTPRLLGRLESNHEKTVEFRNNTATASSTSSSSNELKAQDNLVDIVSTKYSDVHSKLVEMMNHIIKRVRDDTSIKLPCYAILGKIYDNDTTRLGSPDTIDPFTWNLSLTFLDLGLPRCTTSDEIESLLPGLISLVGMQSSGKNQYNKVAHLLLRAVEKITLLSLSCSDHINTARDICCNNENVCQAVYDLFLDVLLYHPLMKGSLSPGLSQVGHERLSSLDIPINQWKTLKYAILDFVSPSRRWCIFGDSLKIGTDKTKSKTSEENEKESTSQNLLCAARTVTLLTVATGNHDPNITERATTYLKAYLDSKKLHITSREVLDVEKLVSIELLQLVIGGVVVSRFYDSHSICHLSSPLGFLYKQGDTDMLTSKRRMVSEKTANVMFEYVAEQVLDSIPEIFSLVESSSHDDEVKSIKSSVIFVLSSLVMMATQNYVGSTQGLSTAKNSQKNPRVAGIRLLNSLTIRLCTVYDQIGLKMKQNKPSLSGESGMEYVKQMKVFIKMELARSMVISSSTVSLAASAYNGDVKNPVGIDIRDICYGIICLLCRSSLIFASEGFVFNQGVEYESPENISQSAKLSITTTQMLFGCVSNECEGLKPRAIAALDALLAAHSRLFEEETKGILYAKNVQQSNPWMKSANSFEDGQASSLVECPSQGKQKLLGLLWSLSSSSCSSTRNAVAQWNIQYIKKIDLMSACHILCSLSGDDDKITALTAREGLGIGENIETGNITNESDSQVVVPGFKIVVSTLFARKEEANSRNVPRFSDFSSKGQAVSLRFGLMCLFRDVYFSDDFSLCQYMSILMDRLSIFYASFRNSDLSSRDSIDCLDEISFCLSECLKSSPFLRQKVVEGFFSINYQQISDLALDNKSSLSRKYFASAFGSVVRDFSLWNCTVNQWIEKSTLHTLMQVCSSKLSQIQTSLFKSSEIHGAAYLGSACLRCLRLVLAENEKNESDEQEQSLLSQCYEYASRILSALGTGITHPDEVIGNACSNSLSIAMSYDSLDSPTLNKNFYSGMAVVLEQLEKALRRYGDGDDIDTTRVSTIIETTGISLGSSAIQSAAAITEVGIQRILASRLLCVDALFDLLGSSSSRKDPELCLNIGEALTSYADASNSAWTSPSTETSMEYNESYSRQLPPHSHVIYVLFQKEVRSSNSLKRTNSACVMLAMIGHAARMSNNDISLAKRSFVKEVYFHLKDFQRCFLSLLADPKSKQLVRESCLFGLAACRGLSMVQAMNSTGDKDEAEKMNESLLKAFGVEYGSVESTQVDLGAFKEMANAAVSVDNGGSILYYLMILSTSLETWTRSEFRHRYNASSLLGEEALYGENLDELINVLQPHLTKLIPRLLRACHDPNKQTREQMKSLWNKISGSGNKSRALINSHLCTTIDVLIEDTSNKFWRTRVGGCGALAEVISGRSWKELGGGKAVDIEDLVPDEAMDGAAKRLLALCRACCRSLDDLRSQVRESGERLSRGLRSLTIRLCDPASVDKGSSEADEVIAHTTSASSTILPWLIKNLNQPSAEATGFVISTLLGVVQISSPSALRPILPDLIGSLLMAMSSSNIFNNLQRIMAGHYLDNDTSTGGGNDRFERASIQIAQSGPIHEALTKCLDMIRSVPVDCQKEIIPHLDKALRSGSGFAAKAVAADAISSLCLSCPSAFNFPGSSMANPTVRLLKHLYVASEREQGKSARDKLAHALGNVCSIAPEASVQSLASQVCNSYENNVGSNDDVAARRAASAALRGIAVRATSQFGDGGADDIWCSRVLPLAFLGRHEEDKVIKNNLTEVWNEGGSVVNTDELFHTTHLEEALLSHLTKYIIDGLGDPSWQRRRLACMALNDLVKAKILSPPPLSSDNNHKVQRKKIRKSASHSILVVCCGMIIKRNLLVWEGKSELLLTTTRIATAWILNETSEAKDLEDLFSWKIETLRAIDREGEILNDLGEFSEMIAGLCRLFLFQATESAKQYSISPIQSSETLSYSAAALHSISELLRNIQENAIMSDSNELQILQRHLYNNIAPALISLVDGHENIFSVKNLCENNNRLPPVIVFRSIECLSNSLWNGIKEAATENAIINPSRLIRLFAYNISSAAWTVRESAAKAISIVVRLSHYSVLRSATIQTILECVVVTSKDKKFWRVRVSSLELLLALCKRARNRQEISIENVRSQDNTQQLMLESLLPHKEDIQKISRSALRDTESKVTAVASDVLSSITWWP